MKKQDSIFYDDMKRRLGELLDSMGTCPSLSEVMDAIYDGIQSSQDTVSALKKRIKYSKNPLEKKNLEKKLNDLYKNRKRRAVN